jgi:integrase
MSKLKEPGYYGDGAGLYLQISKSGSKSWIFKYTRNGRAREMGLGSLHTITMAEARALAGEQRKLLLRGIDPIDERESHKTEQRLEDAKRISFSDAAKHFIEANRSAWSDDQAKQWESSIAKYCAPSIGVLPVGEIDTGMVLKCVEPIWNEKTTTAKRVLGRIRNILDWAKIRGYRTGENPANWDGHLDKVLPAPGKVATVEHHPALPYAEVGEFFKQLHDEDDTRADLMEFLILTALRASEVRMAQWDEFNMDAGLWIVPAERMKAGKEHWVPLSSRCLEILRSLKANKPEGNNYVFPGRRDKPLGLSCFGQLLIKLGRDDITTHGFRSTFRDWAGETTAYPREVIEHALAHQLKDKVEAAYARGTLFEKRRRLMEDWAKFCATVRESSANVVPLQSSTAA